MSGLILPQGFRRRQGGFVLPGMFGSKKGGGAGSAGNRTIVQLTSDVSAGSISGATPYAISWPSPTLDGLGAYSSGNPTRLTIPSSGSYLAYACCASTGGSNEIEYTAIEIRKNGSLSYPGWAINQSSGAGSASGILVARTCQTPIMALTAGDYLEAYFTRAGSNLNLSGTSSHPTLLMLYKLPARNAALAYLNADDTAVNGNVVVPWDAEDFDDSSIWSSGAATNFIVPAGVTRASMTASAFTLDGTQGGTARFGWRFAKGGVAWASQFTIPGNVINLDGGNNDTAHNLYSGPINVSSSDVLTAEWRSTDTSYTRSAYTSACTEMHSRESCSVTLTADVTAVDADTSPPYYVSWNSETFDDASMWSVGSPTRITSPGGWMQVGASVWLSAISTLANAYLFIEHYNSGGTLIARYGNTYRPNSTTPDLAAWTPHINTTAGDYFRCALEVVGDTSVTIESDSRFWAELYAA